VHVQGGSRCPQRDDFIVFGAVTDAKQRPGFPADPALHMITALLSLARG